MKEKDSAWLESNLLLWFDNKFAGQIEEKIREELQVLLNRLLPPVTPFLEKACRFALNVINFLPSKQKFFITDLLILLRKLFKKSDLSIQCEEDTLLSSLSNIFKQNPRNWNGFDYAICLTHDVDYKEGFEFVEEVAKLENDFQMASLFNFLTEGHYRISMTVLENLKKEGFEIGLHGTTHDMALAYRKKEKIVKILKNAKEKLNMDIKGFRSPALSMSSELLDALEETGFEYDSSIPFMNPYGWEVRFPLPYQFEGKSLIELPLTIQDDYLFRDRKFNEKEALNYVLKVIEIVKSLHGVVVLNTHPSILQKHMSFYQELLEKIKNDHAWVVKPYDLVLHMKESSP